jgi:hypothetical protein
MTWLVAAVAAAEVRVEPAEGRIEVRIDGHPFTAYVFDGRSKPILFPVIGPTGANFTRRWPVEADSGDEPRDHPHHESVWFTHGSVNGHDFWHAPRTGPTGPKPSPRIEHQRVLHRADGEVGVLEVTSRWLAADGSVVCTDTRRLEFAADAGARTIDYTITIHADHGPVTFGDTKEGTMALRVHPALQPKQDPPSPDGPGRIINDSGETDDQAWGRPARWVDYSGTIDQRKVGVAILDHPDNLRHPTRWHARDYGLMAANPFGLHDFAGEAPGSGDHTIPAGDSLSFRYLLVLHEGDAAAAGIDDRWRAWAEVAEPAVP